MRPHGKSADRKVRIGRALFFFLLVVSVLFGGCRKDRLSADTIITNAKVYTMDSRKPWAEAVAIRGDRILFVGSSRRALRYQGPATRILDAGGKLLLPGMMDSHVHFVGGSRSLAKVDLSGTRTVEEVQERIRQFARDHPGARWIEGRGWMYAAFPGNMPHRKFLDEVVPDRPAVMSCADGHTTWVNSQALALAGITRQTLDPENGKIVRDENGEPTGALLEQAGSLVTRLIPRPTAEETLASLRQGLGEASRVGVVRVHGMGGEFGALDFLDQLRREGSLTVRFLVTMGVEPPGLTAEDWKAYEEASSRYEDEWLSVRGVKLMLDGVIDSGTAAMLDPYEGLEESRGQLFWNPEDFKKTVLECSARGIQVSTHAIGDAAIRLALDAYEEATRQTDRLDLRHKIEHAENVAASDLPRFGQLGVIASFQPLHANPDPTWMGTWIAYVGPERERRAFPWRAVLDGGGRIAFGSDWPVVTLSPWPGIQVAATRQDFEGRPEGGWVPEQKVELGEAIHAYTLGGAYAMHREKEEGSIEAGKLADLILVWPNIFEVSPGMIRETRVLMTMVGGRIIYESN